MQAGLLLFEPNFQVCEQGALGPVCFIENEVLNQFVHLLEFDPLDEVCFPVFNLVEFIMESEADTQFAIQTDDHFLFGLGQVNDQINPTAENGKPCPAVDFHRVERAQERARCVFLLFHDINRRQARAKPDHVDRFGEMVENLMAGAVNEDVQFEGTHSPILIVIERLASGGGLQCYNHPKLFLRGMDD